MTALCTATQSGLVRTLTPFLYQTKTLLSGQKVAVQNIHSRTAYNRRHFPDSGVTFRSTNISTDTVGASSKADSRIYKPATFYNGDREKPEEDGGREIPWENRSKTAAKFQQKASMTTENRDIPFENGGLFDNMMLSDNLDSLADEALLNENEEGFDSSYKAMDRPARESTITTTERQAFERIFADIMARSKSAATGMKPSFERLENQSSSLTQTSGRGRRFSESVMSITDDAARIDGMKKPTPASSRLTSKTTEEIRADVDQYPVPLRAAAAKALGLASTRNAEPSEDDIIGNENELESIRHPERERVEKLMHNASTDIELWQVMEAEVFALVAKLGLDEKSKLQPEEAKSKGSKKRKKASEVTDDHMATTSDSERPLDLNIYGPLYPSYLLLGLRLLDRAFTKPSPLVLNVLPRIKSLGIVSQVLGASTALYNELLYIYWFRYDDFVGVSTLLHEMEQAGLEFDEETLEIVSGINQAQLKVRRGDKGSVLQALWSMPEFAPGKLRGWKEKIQASIEGSGMEESDNGAWQN